MRKRTVRYRDLIRHALRGYVNGRKKDAGESLPEYPAVLSHYLLNPELGPVFGDEQYRVACDRALYEYSAFRGRKPFRDIAQMRLVFDDIPYPPPATPGFTFVDLFAGIGGIRLAFQNAGGKCLFSSEWDQYARRTYFDNFGEYPFGDIKQFTDPDRITDEELYRLIPDHDVLCAGFPCQPFSIAGVSKKNALGREHGFKDPTQGTLFFDIKRILKVKRPRAFFLENVKHLLRHDSGRTFAVIKETLDALGYIWKPVVVDARKWVPQRRERVFMVGFDPNVIDIALKDVRIPTQPGSGYMRPTFESILESEPHPRHTLGAGTWATLERHKEYHANSGNGFGYGLVPLEIPSDFVSRTISARYHKDGAEVLVEQRGKRPRRLTVNEAKQLQGFDKERFVFTVSDTQAYRQIGNSVVVPAVEATAREMARVLKGGRR